MSNESDILIQEYQKYKDEVSEYEKKQYAYTTQIENYAKDVINQISELKAAGVDLSVLTKYASSDGTIDLTDIGVIKGMITDLYELYTNTVNEGLQILKDR